jgi:hypothetical protein
MEPPGRPFLSRALWASSGSPTCMASRLKSNDAHPSTVARSVVTSLSKRSFDVGIEVGFRIYAEGNAIVRPYELSLDTNQSDSLYIYIGFMCS